MIVEVSKGRQITLPAEIRNKFDIDIGSKIEIIDEDSKIVLQPIKEDIEKMFEEAKRVKPKHNLTPKQMDELNERMLR